MLFWQTACLFPPQPVCLGGSWINRNEPHWGHLPIHPFKDPSLTRLISHSDRGHGGIKPFNTTQPVPSSRLLWKWSENICPSMRPPFRIILNSLSPINIYYRSVPNANRLSLSLCHCQFITAPRRTNPTPSIHPSFSYHIELRKPRGMPVWLTSPVQPSASQPARVNKHRDHHTIYLPPQRPFKGSNSHPNWGRKSRRCCGTIWGE